MYGEEDRTVPVLDEMWDDLVRDGAECVYDPELHAGPSGAIELPDDQAAREGVAREVCASCPVLAECEAYALLARPESGVWAGRTADEIAAESFEVFEGVA